MLLRRFTQHIKEQNWFAVTIDFLVVVSGIFIALQVTEWSESQKNLVEYRQNLVDLKSNLESDLAALEEKIEFNSIILKNGKQVVDTLFSPNEQTKEQKLTFVESNVSLAYESYYIPEKSVFNQLSLTGGFNRLFDSQFKNEIFEYYTSNERDENNMEKSVQLYQHMYITKDILRELFTTQEGAELRGKSKSLIDSLPSLNIKELQRNKNYITAVTIKISLTETQTKNYQRMKLKAKNLVSLIEIELKR